MLLELLLCVFLCVLFCMLDNKRAVLITCLFYRSLECLPLHKRWELTKPQVISRDDRDLDVDWILLTRQPPRPVCSRWTKCCC